LRRPIAAKPKPASIHRGGHENGDGASHRPPTIVLWCARRRTVLPVIDTGALRVIERLPGWRGRFVHSATMTFAHYEFDRGATIHEHAHPEEEVYEVIEGELEIVIDGASHAVRPGLVAIVPANVRHFVKAVTDGAVIVIDHPARPEFG
jgi:mannose-6-phosphate isomerase-like protein (cupin superfamily)